MNTAAAFANVLPIKGQSSQELLALTAQRRRIREGVVLALAARTAAAGSAVIDNPDCSGLILYLEIAAASGTGGLQPYLFTVDPVTENAKEVSAAFGLKTAVGMYRYFFRHAGAALNLATGSHQSSAMIGKSWKVVVDVGDASSYTYTMNYSLIP